MPRWDVSWNTSDINTFKLNEQGGLIFENNIKRKQVIKCVITDSIILI